MKSHRNSQKRIYLSDRAYFVISITKNRYPYFKEEVFCELFVENLILCQRLKGFEIYGWFLGYDHFHILLKPNDKYTISDIFHCLKRNVSRDINKLIEYSFFKKQSKSPQARIQILAHERNRQFFTYTYHIIHKHYAIKNP